MARYDVLSEKNSVERGGSFYLRSKIYFAKEHLMSDFSADLNVSQYDQDEEKLAEEEPVPKEKCEEDALKQFLGDTASQAKIRNDALLNLKEKVKETFEG